MRARTTAAIALLPLLLAVTMSCRRAAPAPDQPATTGPRPDQGIVAFTSGVSWKSEGGSWAELDIGSVVVAGDAVKTAEDAFCEIQFGRVAVVRLEGSSIVMVDELLAQIGQTRINVRLVAGSVMCKVQQLVGTERFRVRTQSAICGVRGTEFGVSAEPDGSTRLVVRSGAVSFTPLAADPDRIAAAIPEEKREAFDEVVEEIEELSPMIVAAGQEALLSARAQATAVAAMQVVEDRITRAVQDLAPATEGQPSKLPAEIEAEITRAVAEVAVQLARSAGTPSPMSDASRQRLAPLTRMHILDQLEPAPVDAAPPARAEAAQPASGTAAGGATDAAPAAAQPLPELTRVAIQVEPRETAINLASGFVATGSFAGFFDVHAPLEFSFTLDGYATQTLRVVPVMGSPNAFQVKLSRQEETIRVEASLQDASIILDGVAVATGTWEGRLPVGSRPTFVVKREGYVDRKLELEITPGSGKTWTVALEPQAKEVPLIEVTVNTAPAGAEILLDGSRAGLGSFTASYAPGTILSFEARKDGYLPGTLEVTVARGARPSWTISLERKKATVRVSVTPADAEIVEDGKVIGTGAWSGERPVGTVLAVAVRRLGYGTREVSLSVQDGESNTVTVDLEPRPVLWQARLITAEKAAPTWRIAIAADACYLADSRGTVSAFSGAGVLLWSVDTANTANENSVPVVAGQRIVFSGGVEMVSIDRRSGRVEWRQRIEGDASHIFGRRVLSLADALVVPEENALVVMDAAGTVTRRVPLAAGSQMSPAAWADAVVITDKEGTVLLFDARDWSLVAEVATDAVQPVAIAATIVGERAYFVDRKGLVVCVDLAGRKVAWQRKLDETKSVGVFQDLAVDAGVVCAYAKNTLYLLSAATGAPLYAPIAGVSAPALLGAGQLVYGTTDGSLKFAIASTGKVVKSLALSSKVAAQPVATGDRIILALANGEAAAVYPSSIR